MQQTVDLICTIFKYCLYLTLVRLVSSAFNWEFGVSRQYLRLLEWLFELGQERIRRAESEHKEPQKEIVGANEKEAPKRARRNNGATQRPTQLDLFAAAAAAATTSDDGANGNKLELASEQNELATPNWRSKSCCSPLTKQCCIRERMRRVSTPDGPPVFLLDDAEDTEEHQEQSGPNLNSLASYSYEKHEFHLDDASRFVVRGVGAIIDDQVTKRFTQEQLNTWNLLTRSNKQKNYQFMSRSLGLCWFTGLLIRYFLLLPLRIVFTFVGFIWLTTTMVLIGLLPRAWRKKPYSLTSLMAFRLLACGITTRLKFHNRHFRAKLGDVCVANHTSPIDVILLGCDNSYSLVGQRHTGLLGLLEIALSRATNHVWFDRGEMRDRQLVTQRLKEHVGAKTNLPVLIFPEGTCINNSAVMMFRKGSFETTDRICPVAIKYDARFGDPFWNSSKQSYALYLLMLMSSWAIKCEVWYLEPMQRLANESSAEFASRVKAQIARKGKLVDLAWDGQLKRSSVKPSWLFQQQEDYANRLKLE